MMKFYETKEPQKRRTAKHVLNQKKSALNIQMEILNEATCMLFHTRIGNTLSDFLPNEAPKHIGSRK